MLCHAMLCGVVRCNTVSLLSQHNPSSPNICIHNRTLHLPPYNHTNPPRTSPKPIPIPISSRLSPALAAPVLPVLGLALAVALALPTAPLPLLLAVAVALAPLSSYTCPNDGSGLAGSTSHAPPVRSGHSGALFDGLYALSLTPSGLSVFQTFPRFAKSGCTGIGVPERGKPSGGAPTPAGSTLGPYEMSP